MAHACSALPGVAPHMRPGQAQRLAQELNQEGSVFDLPRHSTPIDLDIDLRHFAPSPFLYTNTLNDRGLARDDDRAVQLAPRLHPRCHRLHTFFWRHPPSTARPAPNLTARYLSIPRVSSQT